MVSRFGHRLLDRPLRLGAGRDRPTQSKEDVGVTLVIRSWFVALKALGKLIAVIEDVLDGAGHVDHP